ncbi:hypothetical protein [Pseudonocardia broussonetiae]|uniref:Uncharacterized protein n=1 Tax=Pseudonocardia broussonetiae TaxID=2736640 RepID=A0A6M6JJG2_9PSEU|nr:hypothetical protein [Pseudonocardia broussonetiae]QJY47273.1 hypothetical protein HOP40_16875 [Pseudonocardia broussonetiae]
MGTPQGGSPDDGPDAARERPEPDPSVTSFAAPPQDPPWPAPGQAAAAQPPADAAPADPPPADLPPADPPPAEPPPPAASWPPPAGPTDATKVGGWGRPPADPWAKPVPEAPETRMGWTHPAAPPSWPPPDPAAQPWSGQAGSGQPGSGQAPWGAPGPTGPLTAAQPAWTPGPDPSQQAWAPGQQGTAGPPTQVGGPWTGPQPGWPPPTGTQPEVAQQGWPQQGWPQQGAPHPGAPYPGSPYPGSPYPASQYQGAQYPGTQYAAAPYPGTQYSAAQYAGGPYTGGQYAAGRYPGAPYPGAPHPGPRRRRGRLVALVVVGVLLLAALGVGGYLLLTRTTGTVVPADFRPITTATLSYSVPPDWLDSADAGSVLGAPLEGRADAPGYECDGNQYYRGVVASAFVPGERPAAAVASAFARETGSSFYVSAAGASPDVQVSDARPFEVDGVPGQLVEATSRTPTDDGCLATEGTVLILAVPTTGPDGAPGTAVLVVNGDTTGGPSTAPPVPDRSTLEAVLASARLPSV